MTQYSFSDPHQIIDKLYVNDSSGYFLWYHYRENSYYNIRYEFIDGKPTCLIIKCTRKQNISGMKCYLVVREVEPVDAKTIFSDVISDWWKDNSALASDATWFKHFNNAIITWCTIHKI